MNDDPTQHSLLQALADEAKRLEEEALYSHAGHNEEACSSDSWHYWLGIPTALLSAAAGVTSFSSAGAGGGSIWASLAAGILSFGVAALTGLNTVLDPKGRAADHYRAANAFAVIRDEARYLHRVECKKGRAAQEVETILAALRERFAKLNDQTSIISPKAMARGTAKIKAGHYTYTVDIEGTKKGTS